LDRDVKKNENVGSKWSAALRCGFFCSWCPCRTGVRRFRGQGKMNTKMTETMTKAIYLFPAARLRPSDQIKGYDKNKIYTHWRVQQHAVSVTESVDSHHRSNGQHEMVYDYFPAEP